MIESNLKEYDKDQIIIVMTIKGKNKGEYIIKNTFNIIMHYSAS